MCILRVTANISRGIDEGLVKINRKSGECELSLPYFLIRLKGHVDVETWRVKLFLTEVQFLTI